MGSSKKATVGYRYHMGLHFGICHGPVDSINNIIVGERAAWTGDQTASGSVTVSAPNLFGGDSREGGIVGQLDVMMGEPAQAQNSYLSSLLGAGIPAFRGILSAVWRGGQVAANNPYVKPWAFRIFRVLKGWTNDTVWYPEKAKIGGYVELPLVGWTDHYDPTIGNMLSVTTGDPGNLVALGQTGVRISTDGGLTWSSPIPTNAVNGLAAICQYDENTYVAVGISSATTRSTDKGLTWVSQGNVDPSDYPSQKYLVKFGSLMVAVGVYSKPSVSSDGGATWTVYPSVLGYVTVYSVLAVGSTVYIAGTNGRYTYWVGGAHGWASWNGTNYSGYATNGLGGGTMLTMFLVNGVVWAAGANGRVGALTSGAYQTILGGTGFSIYGGASNGSTVIVGGTGGRLQRSTDAGVTWDAYITIFGGTVINDVRYSNSIWYVGGDNGRVAVSIDDGVTWTQYSSVAGLRRINEINEINGTLIASADNGFLSVLPMQVYPPTGDMNPAHIVYQCLTDTAWGMGYPTGSIDSTSFTDAANALYDEGFGLSMLWNRQETIEAFVQVVLDHIGGMLYVKPDTGAFALKLIRDDYDRVALPQYGPTNLISAEDYQRQAWGETINEITVVYTDHDSGKEASLTTQDAANILTQGGIVSQTRTYSGIRQPPLAQRVAQRDLNAASTPLARIRLTATRAAWAVFPGDVFRLTWPEYGIADVVYRALNVNLGTLTDGKIIIDAVEDVFGLPGNTYLVDQPSAWEDPTSAPAPAPYRALLEAPYWDLVRNLSAADMAYVDNLSGYLETLAIRPSSDATNYGIAARTGSADYTRRGNGDFCPTATISGDLTKTTTAITLANGVDLDIVEVGGYAVIDGEYVLVSAIDLTAGTATIARGLLDTVPVAHADGARIWFADGWQGFDTTEAVDGETIDVKLLPMTGRGELAIADAPVNSITFDQRQYRPYAPGKVLINTSAYPEWIDGMAALSLSWAHRDRLLQTAYLVKQDESSIGPEAGTTYNIRIYGETDTLIKTYSGLSGTSQTYATADETTDSLILIVGSASYRINGRLRVEIESVRGGLVSYQKHNHAVLREGYGFNYGYYYGGQ